MRLSPFYSFIRFSILDQILRSSVPVRTKCFVERRDGCWNAASRKRTELLAKHAGHNGQTPAIWEHNVYFNNNTMK